MNRIKIVYGYGGERRTREIATSRSAEAVSAADARQYAWQDLRDDVGQLSLIDITVHEVVEA